jgi:predicted transposase YbfD/YdcC
MAFAETFSNLTDFRADNRTYPLSDIIFIAVCMILCGADSWAMVSELGKSKLKWLRRYLELPNGIPSHHTFSRVFEVIDPQEFSQCFINWITEITQQTKGELIAIDGKTLRRSYNKKDNKTAIHMVSAWASQTGMVLGQKKTEEKSNEITAIPVLLDTLELSGCIVSIDAMGCQKSIAKKIIEKEADYLLALKGNQGTLHEDVKLFMNSIATQTLLPAHASFHETIDKGHGRIELRRCWISTRVNWLTQKSHWKGLKTFIMVESERHKDNKIETEKRYFISSKEMTAETCLGAVRSHWSIENNLHWVLDVAFCEDNCRINKGNSAESMAVLRHIALNMIKKDKSNKLGVKNRRILAAANDDYRDSLLQLLFEEKVK